MREKVNLRKLSETESSITIFLVVIWALLISFAFVAAKNPPWLRKLAELGQTNESTSLKGYGDNFMRHGNYVNAISQYKKALDINPDDPMIITNIAIAYHRAGNSEEGLKLLNKALNIKSGTKGIIYFNLAEIFYDLGRKTEAIENYLKAVDTETNQELLFYKIGITYKEIGQLAKARESLEKAVEIHLEPKTPYLNMIRTSLVMYENNPKITSALNAILAKGVSENDLNAYDLNFIKQINSSNGNIISIYRELVKVCLAEGDSLGAVKYAELAQNNEMARKNGAGEQVVLSSQ